MNLRFSLLILLSLVGIAFAAEFQRERDRVASGELKEARAIWWGFDRQDATTCLQSALDSGATKVWVDHTGSDWIVGPINVPSNIEVIFADKVVLRGKKGAFVDPKMGLRILQVAHQKNVVLRGQGEVSIIMDRDEYRDGKKIVQVGQRHNIWILDSDNITVDNFAVGPSGGDCVYVGSKNCRNVRLENLRCKEGLRQGFSVTGVDNLYVGNCKFDSTAGAAPEAGLDLEPNYPDGETGLTGIVFENCEFTNNNTFGIYVANNSKQKIDVTFKDCLIKGNADGIGVGHVGHPDTPLDDKKGTLAFINCRVEGNKNTQFSIGHHLPGVKLLIKDCTIDSRNSSFQALRISSNNTEDIEGLEIRNLTVFDDQARDPIKFERRFGNGLVNPIIEPVKVINTDGSTRTFDPAALILASIPDPMAKSFTIRQIDRRKLTPMSSEGKATAHSLRYREVNDFLLYAKAGDSIKIRFHNKPVHRYEEKHYRDPLEITIGTPTLETQGRIYVPFDEALDYVLEAGETGVYRFTMNARTQTLQVFCDAPGQGFAADEKLYVFGSHGDLYFAVPAGVEEVKIEMNGAPREESTVRLFDAQGNERDAAIRSGGGKILYAKRDNTEQLEIWKISLSAAKLWLRIGSPLPPIFSTTPENILLQK